MGERSPGLCGSVLWGTAEWLGPNGHRASDTCIKALYPGQPSWSRSGALEPNSSLLGRRNHSLPWRSLMLPCPNPPAVALGPLRSFWVHSSPAPSKLEAHLSLGKQGPSPFSHHLLSPSEQQQTHRQEVPRAPPHEDRVRGGDCACPGPQLSADLGRHPAG